MSSVYNLKNADSKTSNQQSITRLGNIFPPPTVENRADNLIIISKVMAERAFTKL